MSPASRRLLRWCGAAIALAGAVFVLLALWEHGARIDLGRFPATAWGLLLAMAALYGIANGMLALAWRNLLWHFGARVAPGWALKAYGISQLAKYVPGNVFHLAGRQAIGMASGVRTLPLAKSALWELGLLSAAGVLVGPLALPLLAAAVPAPAGIAVSVLAFAGAAALLARLGGVALGRALAWHAGFLAASGIIFSLVLELASMEHAHPDLPRTVVCGAFALAWLAGLLTPGAPAGVGVRELALLVLLEGAASEADLLLAVLLARAVTLAGDALFFAAAASMPGSPAQDFAE